MIHHPAACWSRRGALMVALIAFGAGTASSHGQTGTQPETDGRIIPGPANVRAFRPTPQEGIVAAQDINLLAVFEQLGEDATLWYQHVLTLSNPFFEGRAPGTRGGTLAADYIEHYLRAYGLAPGFPADREMPGGGSDASWTSYRQGLSFRNPRPQVDVIHASLTLGGPSLVPERDFAVLGNSGSGAVSAPVTFVGYGIASGPDGYTSFEEETDLSGRLALLLRYEPLDDEGNSQWSERRFSRQSRIARKMRTVSRRHPAGILLVDPPGAVHGTTGLETLQSSAAFGRSLDVPVLQLSQEAAEALLARTDPEGRDLMTWRRLADRGEVKAVHLDDRVMVSVETELEIEDDLFTDNIAGVLGGKGDLADEWIVIGAHYDHVGYGYTGSMPGNVGQLHPGADDNASGTAGMLLLAKRMVEAYAEAEEQDLRSVLFMAFAAEEAGLRGSRYYVEHSTIPADEVTLMINMDMIGRLRGHNLSLGGTGTAEEFDELLRPILLESGLTVSESRGGRGPSDHSSFYGAGVPVLFFFTGLHSQYHTPQDRGYTVNPAGAVKIIDLVEDVALEFASQPRRLTYVASAGGQTRGQRMGVSVRLGIVPAYGAEVETGVLVDDVGEGTSAAVAGVKPGDILIGWNAEEVTDGRTLMELLREHSPGDLVRVKVLRDEQELTLDVTLQAREEG